MVSNGVDSTDDVGKARKKKAPNEALQAEINLKLHELNKLHAVVQRGSSVYVMREGFDVKGQPEISYMSTKDFMVKVAYVKVWDNEDKKYIPIAPIWLSWKDRREYDGIYFRPGDEERPRFYNLWRGFRCEPRATGGSCRLIIDHIKNNICNGNEESFTWVMAWLADIFQNPASKPGTALVMRGEMGIGKGAFANHVGYLLGHHYLTVANGSQVTGRFNSHLAERVLMFVDESFWSGERVGAGVLRALITEPQQSSEMKGKDVVMIDSFLRLMIAANDEWVVPVGMADERRFTVLDVGKERQRDIAYFTEMKKELVDGGYNVFLNMLLNYEYDKELPKNILSTDALLDQKLHSMKDEMRWWYDCLNSGSIAADSNGWPTEEDGMDAKEFYNSYSNWSDIMKCKRKLSRIGLPRALNKFVFLKKRRNMGIPHYHFTNLDTCRDQFSKAVGHEIVWEDSN